ncbi:hypothetical protein EUGRSUZ_E02925 [Eucalyptus grandis]|uniref:Uncharacterized protein n=2 Tax=Eucalyptus grandis TaxID=71139 RepID=A0ACC3KZM0_EUCGR|nr:hypothetical protein EUGRSUZ_E02925 [Eucalyptus grandis]
MIHGPVPPDEITLTELLSSGSHSGMLQKGRCLLRYFSGSFSIKLKHGHYACMVDVLGQCGKLEVVEDLVRNMPLKANSIVVANVLLSHFYASANRGGDILRLGVTLRDEGIVKQLGRSWITIKGQQHLFLSGPKSHPLSENIYWKLHWLKMKLSLHDMEDKQKEESLFYHSERLAVAFALISIVEGSGLTVMKNLHICGDCHSTIKLVANIVDREIVVRDPSHFCRFRSGVCSCVDYR